MEKLEELQGQREQLAVAMQELDPEAQRLIYPILRLKMVQHPPPAPDRPTHHLAPPPRSPLARALLSPPLALACGDVSGAAHPLLTQP